MKTRQTFLIILLCVGATLVSNAQNTFNKAYDIDSSYEIGNSVTVFSDGYLLSGTGTVTANNFSYIIKLLKVDTSGNVIWWKKYGNENVYMTTGYSGSIATDPDGNFYLVGSYADTFLTECFLVGKFDAKGDSLWTRKMDYGTGRDLLLGLYYDSVSRQLYTVGAAEASDASSAETAIWVLDTAGNTKRVEYFGSAGFEYGRSIIRIRDTIYISGYKNLGNQGEPYLMKLDTLLNVISVKYYGTGGNDDFAGINYRSARMVMWGLLDTIDQSFGTPFVSMLDLSGNVVWKRLIKNYDYVYQAKISHDGNIHIVGTTSPGNHNGFILKLDKDGKEVWKRVYSYNTQSSFYSLCTFFDFNIDTVSGSIIIAGDTQRDPTIGDSTKKDFWLVKLDSLGCLVPGCDTITEVGIQPIEAIGTQVTVYPNPANGKATVLLNHGKANSEALFTLYGISGQVLTTEKHLLNLYGFGEWQVDLTGREPGIYIYHILHDGKVIEGKLLVE